VTEATTVWKTRRMWELEQRHGEPLEELLRRLYREHGSTRKVGEVLGVSGATVWYWMFRLGISRRQWSPAGEVPEAHG
jgi:transcriptional regulator of aromatic amino acid metabolism